MDPAVAMNQIFSDVLAQLTGIFTDVTVVIAGLVSISLLVFGLSQISKLFQTTMKPEDINEEDDSVEGTSNHRETR